MTWVLVYLVSGAYWGGEGDYVKLELSGAEHAMAAEINDYGPKSIAFDEGLSVAYGYAPDQCQTNEAGIDQWSSP